jgi:hypothetical protein
MLSLFPCSLTFNSFLKDHTAGLVVSIRSLASYWISATIILPVGLRTTEHKMLKKGEAEVTQAMDRQPKMRGDIILLPQPSDDIADPLVSIYLLPLEKLLLNM